MEEIHSQDSQRLLLLDRIAVEQVHVQEEGGRWLAWLGLEAQPDPAASVLIALWLPGGDGVGEGEEGAAIAPDWNRGCRRAAGTRDRASPRDAAG